MQNNIRLISGLLFISMFGLVACTSSPFIRHKSPNIIGTIHSNNEPVKGIHLYLSIASNDKHCSKFIAQSVTDDKGKFSITSIKEKMDYTPLMTHYLDEWTLCVDVAGIRQAIYSNNRYGQGSVITSVNLECDLKNLNRQSPPCNVPLLKD